MSVVSQIYTFEVRENVVFEKLNEVYINEGRWLVTFVHDLKPLETLVTKLRTEMKITQDILESVTDWYQKEYSVYFKTFSSLNIEVDLLNDTFYSIHDSFQNYQIMSNPSQNYQIPETIPIQDVLNDDILRRRTRSLLPIIGDALSFLFGTVSESDLDQINNNIDILNSNQQQIIHDLNWSLSVLNVTRFEVAKNRKSIIEIIGTIQNLDKQILDLKNLVEQKFARLEQFIHTYLQFQLIMDELKMSTQNAVTYLENLKMELNMLAMHHLSTGIISPSDLKTLLIDIETKLPVNFELPAKPREDIWHYYKTIMSFAYLEKDQIRIVVQIPLVKATQKFELYKIHNLPLSFPREIDETYSAKYKFETEYMMISKSRTSFAFLDYETAKHCKNPFVSYCDPKLAFMKTSLIETCITSLFLKLDNVKQRLCKSYVSVGQLPAAKYLSSGIWVISTNKPLTFTVNCRKQGKSPYSEQINAPFGILKLNNTCRAVNKYLELSEHYEKGSNVDITDPLKSLLTLRNISKVNVWGNFSTEFQNITHVDIPSDLLNLKEMPMIDFMNHVKLGKYKNVSPSTTRYYNVYLTVIICLILVFIIPFAIIVCIFKRKIICNKISKHKSKKGPHKSCTFSEGPLENDRNNQFEDAEEETIPLETYASTNVSTSCSGQRSPEVSTSTETTVNIVSAPQTSGGRGRGLLAALYPSGSTTTPSTTTTTTSIGRGVIKKITAEDIIRHRQNNGTLGQMYWRHHSGYS